MDHDERSQFYLIIVVLIGTATLLNYLFIKNARSEVREVYYAVDNLTDEVICLQEGTCDAKRKAEDEMLRKFLSE